MPWKHVPVVGTVVASPTTMALPYPREVETDDLDGPPPSRSEPLRLEQLVAEAMFCRDGELYAFGKKLVAGGARSTRDACTELRGAIIRRMQERLPFAESTHWDHLVTLMKAQLNDGDTATHAAQMAVRTIDSM